MKVKDFELVMANMVIDANSEASTTARLLAELIRCSEYGAIGKPAQIAPQLQKLLGISDVNYRATMVKLTKLKLIRREDGEIKIMFIKGPTPDKLLIERK